MLSGHLIALQGKRPIDRGWQHVPWNGEQRRGQDGIGIIPWSLGCVVVDVDDPAGEQAAIDALGEPLARQDTPSGGVHLIYRANKSLPNRKWTHGDIRGGRGYVKVYDRAAWRAVAALRYDATAPDLAALPVARRSLAKAATTEIPASVLARVEELRAQGYHVAVFPGAMSDEQIRAAC